jgi:hypothetical protein
MEVRMMVKCKKLKVSEGRRKTLSEYSMQQKIFRETNERDDKLLGYACGILAEKHLGLNDLLNALIEIHTMGYNAGVKAGKKAARNEPRQERKAA